MSLQELALPFPAFQAQVQGRLPQIHLQALPFLARQLGRTAGTGFVHQAFEAVVDESFAPAFEGAGMFAEPLGNLIGPVSFGDQQYA